MVLDVYYPATKSSAKDIYAYLIVGAGDTTMPIKENAGFVAKYAPEATLKVIPGPIGHEIFCLFDVLSG